MKPIKHTHMHIYIKPKGVTRDSQSYYLMTKGSTIHKNILTQKAEAGESGV